MDQEQTLAALLSENKKLGKENNNLKSVLGLVKENQDLRARMQSFNHDTLEFTGCSFQSQRKSSGLCQDFDENQFKTHLQQSKFKHEHRTSSPVDFKSFIHSSMHTHTSEKAEGRSSQTDAPIKAKGQDRLLGEIAYQLDKRILSHVFQGHKRLYGFTLLNIPEKIIEVSTHPLTGKVDEGYRVYLTQRHADLMERLHQLGYKATLHPTFIEFIINTYGILKERPDEHSNQAMKYNNPDFLEKLILTTAAGKLQKDLLIVLNCLSSMAEKDGKSLLLW